MSQEARSAAQDQELLDVARDLRDRADQLLTRWAPDAERREDRLVMIGDAAVMEHAAGVIEDHIPGEDSFKIGGIYPLTESAVGMRVGQVWRQPRPGKNWTVLRVGKEKAQLRADHTAFVVMASVWIDHVLASPDWILVADVKARAVEALPSSKSETEGAA